MLVELHCHSTCSDGDLAPDAVARRASARRVELFCLTDHDSVRGSREARAAFAGGVALRGVELSCHHEARTVHLLVYQGGRARPGAWGDLEVRLGELAGARRDRLVDIAERLAELGAPVDVDAILAAVGEGSVGRPHIARALVSSGAVRTTEEAFTRYLRDGGPADVRIERLSLEDALALGKRAGARMSLAHPHTLGELSARILRRFRKEGLEGVEAYYGSYREGERRQWLALADELDLVVTAGSDFHGQGFPLVREVGVELPEPRAARLREWLEVQGL